MSGEVEEGGKILQRPIGVARIGQLGVRIPQLIKERMAHGLDRRETLSRGILEETGDEVDGIWRSFAEDLSYQISERHIFGGEGLTLLKGCGLIWGNLCSM